MNPIAILTESIEEGYVATPKRRMVCTNIEEGLPAWAEHIDGNTYRSLTNTLSNVILRLPANYIQSRWNGLPTNLNWGHIFEGVEFETGIVTPICIVGIDLSPREE